MYMFEVLHCIFVGIVVSDRSLIGLSLTYTISLTGMFQYVIRQSAEVENLVSICSIRVIMITCSQLNVQFICIHSSFHHWVHYLLFTYLTSLYILSDDIL